MKHNLLKSVIISIILLMGVSNAWGKTIYLYTDGIGWPDNSAKIWVHAWGSGQDTDKQMTKVKEKLYKVDIPDADTKVIFTRTQSTSTGVWDKEWNRVGEQSLNDETPCLKLTDWTTGTWGKISYDAHIYLDNSVANWSEATKEFIIGHSSYSNTYTMTNISNTKLYYLAFSDIWHGYWDYGFIGVTSHWGEYKDKDITNRIKDATKRTGTRGDQVINGTKLFVPENANNDANLTKTDLSGYSKLNYTQTIKSAVKLAGQNYAEANAKAAITVTSYNLTDNGVISSQNSASISTSSQSTTISAARTATTTLTVGTVATGYQFDGWYTAATGGTQLSASTTYTYYPTEAKTVYARFSEITYSVQVQSADNNQGTVSPTSVNAGQFTGVNITATPKIGYSFANWTTDDIIIANAYDASTTITATKEGTVTANFEAQPSTTIYLEPTGYWNSDNPQFVAHVWNNISGDHKDIIMIGIGDSPHRYYEAEVPYGCTNVVFYRKSTDGTAIWNQTADLPLPTNDNVLYTITSTGNKKKGDDGYVPASGGWKATTNLTYDITLYSSEFGNYGFTYNGQTYTSPASGSIVYQVPIGATVQLFANPHNAAYRGDIMVNQGGNWREIESGNTPLTINCNTILDDNYKTTDPHVVYLAVPNTGDWVNNAATEHYAYAFHSRTESGKGTAIEMTELPTTVYVEQVQHYCYRCEIPAGYNTIRFEKRTSGDVTNIKTVDLNYQIPFNRVNCYRLNGKSGDLFTGVWETVPAIANDYRILYVEQTVKRGETQLDKSHASDIVKLTNTDKAIVSLHLYNKRVEGVNGTNNAAVILQRCTGYDAGVAQWEDVEYHMVYDRLHADASTALLPGRRNTVELRDHDGLDVIKAVANNAEYDFGSGVWNFTIQKTDGSATLLLDAENLTPYTGNYYIRTSNAEGGWNNYSIPANHMTFSSYAKKNSDFSHYFCKWVDTSKDSRNVKFVIANDHGANISKELAGDEIIGQGTSYLPANANVRWQWNMVTNEVKRAYIQGSDVQDFLTVTESDETTTKFRDNGNWIYEADITAKVNEKITAITAPYNQDNQSLLEKTYQTGGMPMLTGDIENTSDYTVRVQYDFKINKTIALLIPGGNTIASAIDVLIERTNQYDATQVSVPITASNPEKGYTVYAVMSFTRGHIVEGSGTQSEKLYYWVSFPFDVRISDVFGFGEYGVHWIMEYYDGAERARNGAWIDSPTYWRYITDTTSVNIPANNKNLNCGILKANQGYVLALALNIADMGIFTKTDKVSLYFPSMSPITTQIDGNIIETTVTLDEYKCNIERDNRKIHDSNWHIIGVPSFSNKTQTLTQNDLLYFYTRDQKNDTYNPTSAKDAKVTFKSLHSYMVQYAGTINWVTGELQPKELAAKRNANEEKTHSLRLELSQNGTYNDQTLVTLQEEGATEAFDMNLDLSKMMNAGNNIYTLAGKELIQVAGNALPIANTTIPVGVQIATAGEYTFAMPDGTDGITVELIDYETNTHTNLLLSDYTVNLPTGTCETRFALSVKIDKTATSVENITEVEGANGEGVKKYIIDGKLFLQKDHTLYDAQGHIVR